jgi:hypothetical protein
MRRLVVVVLVVQVLVRLVRQAQHLFFQSPQLAVVVVQVAQAAHKPQSVMADRAAAAADQHRERLPAEPEPQMKDSPAERDCLVRQVRRLVAAAAALEALGLTPRQVLAETAEMVSPTASPGRA